MLLPSLVVLLTADPTAHTTPPPVTARFRIDQRLEQEVDASAVGGPKQTNVIKFSAFVTVTTFDSAGGRAFKAVVDSIHADSIPAEMGADPFGTAKGAAATGTIDVKGRPRDVKWDRDLQGLGGGNTLLEVLFGTVKTGAKPGDQWSDTTSSTSSMQGGSINTSTLTNFKLVGPDQRGKHKGTRVDGSFASALAGSGDAGGALMEIEGTGNGTVSNVVAPYGLLIAGQVTGNQNLSITIPTAPSAIPVAVKSTTSVSRLD